MGETGAGTHMIPETSTTLLKDISDSSSARWPEFVSRYRPMMVSYLKSHFPAVDADDMVQETLIALAKALPRYRYDPGETGRFRNYLTGILRNKALKSCERADRDRAFLADLRDGAVPLQDASAERGDAAWREALIEIAMRQLLADEQIPDKSKQMFQRLTVVGVVAKEVAAEYGASIDSVYQTKSRMMARLREIVRALEAAADV